jgi:A/G-specific adenine glycosylase
MASFAPRPGALQTAMPDSRPGARAFARALIAWSACHGRHDLPWQAKRSAYRIWVSEVMLQQTQVASVAAYFPRFVARFPSVAALAAAPLDEVLHHWSGLGYYARARNLHRAARLIRERHGGRFPRDFAAVSALPGVGRSTAGAILALACGERHPILDGNVKRVLARWGGIEGYPGSAPVADALWALSEALTPTAQVDRYTQAIMDLGATVCTRARPGCGRCPVSTRCVARAAGRQDEIPAPRPKRARPRRRVYWLVLRAGSAVLLEQRPPSGIWGGLWGFPEFASRAAAEAAAAASGSPVRARAGPRFTHAFTHFELEVRPLLAEVGSRPAATEQGVPRTWYNARQPARLGLAAPVAALIERLDPHKE